MSEAIPIEFQDDREQQAQERDLRAMRNDLRAVMATEEGKRVLGRIAFEMSGVLVPTGGAISDFRQGVRHVGVQLLDFMAEADSATTVTIMQEAHFDEYSRNHRDD